MSNYPGFLEDMMAALCNYYQELSVVSHNDDPVNIDAVITTYDAANTARLAEDKAKKNTKHNYILASKVAADAILATAQVLYTALKVRFDVQYQYADDSPRANSGFYEAEANIKWWIYNVKAKIDELAEEIETGIETRAGIECSL